MFEDVVFNISSNYKKMQQYTVTRIDTETPGILAAVDGGAAILWSNTVQSIGVVTAGYIVYNATHQIVTHKMMHKAVLLQGEDIDMHRFSCELSCLKEAAAVADCVLFDGALQDIPNTPFKRVIDSIPVTVMGISKKTRIDTLQKGVPDTEILNYPGKWYYKVDAAQRFNPLGDIYIAKLHERGPSFRVDVTGTPCFDRLVYFSKYLFCLGYPYPLLEIHKATTLRDKKEYYQTELQKTMVKNGLKKEYLAGVYHLEREREEFHRVLDGLV